MFCSLIEEKKVEEMKGTFSGLAGGAAAAAGAVVVISHPPLDGCTKPVGAC